MVPYVPRSLRASYPTRSSALCASCPTCCALVPTCPVSYVLSCSTCLMRYVLSCPLCLTCSGALRTSCSMCSLASRALVPYMLSCLVPYVFSQKATRTLFWSGETPKGLGRDIFYIASKYMLRREQKTSHFGVVGECEEDE